MTPMPVSSEYANNSSPLKKKYKIQTFKLWIIVLIMICELIEPGIGISLRHRLDSLLSSQQIHLQAGVNVKFKKLHDYFFNFL